MIGSPVGPGGEDPRDRAIRNKAQKVQSRKVNSRTELGSNQANASDIKFEANRC